MSDFAKALVVTTCVFAVTAAIMGVIAILVILGLRIAPWGPIATVVPVLFIAAFVGILSDVRRFK